MSARARSGRSAWASGGRATTGSSTPPFPTSCLSAATAAAGSTRPACSVTSTDCIDVPCRAVAAPEQDQSFVDRLSRQGEEVLGKIAEELISNPVINGAIARTFEAREKAVQAQEAAMGALNLPSAADIERVTRRLRSLSQRLEGIEDAIDRLEERVAGVGGSPADERIA